MVFHLGFASSLYGLLSRVCHIIVDSHPAVLKLQLPIASQRFMTKTACITFSCLQVLVYGDCAVNTDPDPEQLAKIGITSAETAAAFGIEPRVAFLSYSTFGSGAGPDVDKACFLSTSLWLRSS